MIRLCPALLLLPACSESVSARDVGATDRGSFETSVVDRGPAREQSPSDGPRLEGAVSDGTQPAHDCKNPDPAWLLCEDFEGMSQGVAAWFKASGWTESIGVDNPGRVTSSTDAHRGTYAVHMPAAASAGYQGGDLIWRACDGTNKPGCATLKGYPQLYLRTFVKLASDHKKVHHFLSVGGGPIDDYWAPFGNAGCRPNGKRGMGTTVDFKDNTHATFFYTYFPDMKCDSQTNCAKYADPQQICTDCAAKEMPCTSGLECCWGNEFAPTPAVTLPLGTWFCFEMMMKPNDIGQSNGEMAYWIDGTLAHQVKNMKWRTDSKLQMNSARLQHYLTTGDAASHSNQVWFDDVVVSTKPVGCQ